ncbi:MAG: hypothetical protein RL115_1446, partial [Bacteroidota bacterium]
PQTGNPSHKLIGTLKAHKMCFILLTATYFFSYLTHFIIITNATKITERA